MFSSKKIWEKIRLMPNMNYPVISEPDRLRQLMPRRGRHRVVIDTDTFNEVDDQFALVYALKSGDRLEVEAIYAAPFTNERAKTPSDGMRASYEEILRLLSLMGLSHANLVYKGSDTYVGPTGTPCRSAATLDLIARAMTATAEDPLYVVGLAALSNIASAILIEPSIIQNIVIIWLGGHALYWPDTLEFNLKQDIFAARLVLDCGVPLVLMPCNGVVRALNTTVAELERYLEPTGQLGAFLTDRVRGYSEEHIGWSKPIWDMAPIAYLINEDWAPSDLVHSPVLTEQGSWSKDTSRHLIRCTRYVHRNKIFRDFFAKLAKPAGVLAPP